MTIDKMKEKARERLERLLREQEKLRWEWKDTPETDKELCQSRYTEFIWVAGMTSALFDAYAELGILSRVECEEMGRRIINEMSRVHEAKEK